MTSKPKKEFSDFVNGIIDSYQAQPKTRHIDAGLLPDRKTIIDIIYLLRELLFPGYFGKQGLTSKMLKRHVHSLLNRIQDLLVGQVQNAVRHQAARRGAPIPNAKMCAEEAVADFLSTVPAIREALAKDVQAAFEGDPAAADTDEIIFSYPGLFAIMVHRLAHELHKRHVPLIPRMMSEYAHNATGIDIHPGARIGDYFFIDHGTGVVIGETTTIGERVRIYQGVTLGALSTRGGQSLRGAKRHPTIEDDVTIYSGASILGGGTTIGKGVVVSSNVFLTQSVPAGTRVTMKNPELQYRDQNPKEFKQDLPPDWVI